MNSEYRGHLCPPNNTQENGEEEGRGREKKEGPVETAVKREQEWSVGHTSVTPERSKQRQEDR